MKNKILYTVLSCFLLLSACTDKKEASKNTKPNEVTKTKSDYEHLVLATNWYQQSAEMQACYIQAFNWAKVMLINNLENKPEDKPGAVVMDIDETILDNSPFEVKCIETGKGYSTESWIDWTSKEKATALPGTLDFIKFAQDQGVDVFYISNRKTVELENTMNNMKALGFPFIDTTHFLLKDDSSNKTARRNKVAETHEIILLIGDALTDFSDIYSNRNELMGKDLVEKDKDLFGTKYIILPNPMYGEWEKAIYKNSFDYSEAQKDSLRKSMLINY